MRKLIAIIILFASVHAFAGSFGGERGAHFQTPAGDDAPPTYCASTNGTVATGTTNGTVTSIFYIWHPASVTKRYKVRYAEIRGDAGTGTGKYLLRITSITAQNGTPGGTLQPALPLVPTNPSSDAVVRSGAAAPTRTVGDYFVDSMSATVEVDVRLDSIPGFQPFTLPASVAAGIELRTEVTATLASSANIAAWVCWTED